MKRIILGTAATSFGLFGLGAFVPAVAQDAERERLLEAAIEECVDAQPPCLTPEGMILLKNGRQVTVERALEALGIAAPDVDIEGEASVSEGNTEPTTPGEEVAADIEHEEVVEEEILAEELAEDASAADVEEIESETIVAQEIDAGVEAEPLTEETASTTEAAEEPAPGEAEAVEMTEELLQQQAIEEANAAAKEEAETSAVAAQADVAAEGEDVEVQTETVTEETARSSSEEFEATASPKSKDDGLSDLEKFLIGAVGAAVIGEVLSADDEVVANTGDRVIVERDGQLRVLKNDDALLRQPGSQVTTETFSDGSTRTTLNRENGAQVITIRSADGRVLRRERVLVDGTRVVLFDDTQAVEDVDVAALPETTQKTVTYEQDGEDAALRAALAASQAQSDAVGRRFSLSQIRSIRAVRELAPEIELTNVNFRTGSAAITPSEAEELAALGRAMRDAIAENPREVFLVEGHTDAVGAATMNLALSDRRAESLALALTEYFDVPPENMIVQGYGERYLKVPTVDAERANRRAAVRVITPLLTGSVDQ
ncbi:OmpA family protein [Celeribacter litoreus]|uniref:OmpA family protein n=1 Tax=Celeribacter litoreus TaxID=2876714 RepID=UPI001CC95078|nr:OmpA family protein [Celeribacter litoreus]MCA0044467.1 OmpA family protein [Celeribacter litoreus]